MPDSLGPLLHDAIVDVLGEAVVAIDAEKRILVFNRRAEALLKCSRADAIGRPCSRVIRSDLCAADCPHERTLNAHGPLHGITCTLRATDDLVVPVSVTTTALRDENGNPAGIVVLLRDERPQTHPAHSSSPPTIPQPMVGHSPALQRVLALLPNLCASDANVLIRGETGTGKELFAQAIHAGSRYANGPLVVVNCGALPESLFESELFGYRRGAFTDARAHKTGWLEQARGGTLVLDEVSELPHPTQVKLLRVIQQREYAPLGSVTTKHLNCRLIAISNRDLTAAIAGGAFRDDLYYRLAVLSVSLPPLRERREDIPLLVDCFVQRHNAKGLKTIHTVDPAVIHRIMQHPLRGNVRELENLVEAAIAYAKDGVLDEDCLSPERSPPLASPSAPSPRTHAVDPATHPSLQTAQATTVEQALRVCAGSPSKAARLLKIGRSSIYRKMKEHGINPADFRGLGALPPPPSGQSCAQSSADPPSERPCSRNGARPTVLYIDDDPLARRTFSRLHDSTCHVLPADTAENALAVLRSGQSVDLVVCDFIMPNIDGSQFLEMVANDFPHLVARFIFLTGAVTAPDRTTVQERLGRPFYPKPLLPADLDRQLACL